MRRADREITDFDELIAVMKTDGKQDILLASANGMVICFNENDVRVMGRDAAGVRGMMLDAGDYVVGAGIAAKGKQLLSVTEYGYGKRTEIEAYLRLGEDGQRRPQNRGGKGVKCYKITEKTGYVIGVKAVTDENEIMMITTEGIIIQIRMDDVSQLGRITSGVKLINLDAGVTVAQIAKVREKVSDGNQEFDDVDDAMEDVSKPSEVDQEEDDDPAEEHITMPEETEEDE